MKALNAWYAILRMTDHMARVFILATRSKLRNVCNHWQGQKKSLRYTYENNCCQNVQRILFEIVQTVISLLSAHTSLSAQPQSLIFRDVKVCRQVLNLEYSKRLFQYALTDNPRCWRLLRSAMRRSKRQLRGFKETAVSDSEKAEKVWEYPGRWGGEGAMGRRWLEFSI